MSDIQSDIDVYDEDYESSDEETMEIQDSMPKEVLRANMEENSKYPALKYLCSLPSKFHTHSLVSHRQALILQGAEPLVEDPQRQEISNGNYPYDEIKQHLMDVICKEIEEGVSPMTYFDEVHKEVKSIQDLDKELNLYIIREAIALSKE